MPEPHSADSATELFRFARVYSPRVVDLQARLAGDPKFSKLVDNGDPRQQTKINQDWAKEFRQSKAYVNSLDVLGLTVFDYLDINELPADRLPCKKCIKDPPKYERFLKESADDISDAKRKLLLSLYASVITNSRETARAQSQAFQFLELLPQLHKIAVRQPYAPFVLSRRHEPRKCDSQEQQPEARTDPTNDQPPSDEPSRNDILLAWDMANEYAAWKRKALKAEIESRRKGTFIHAVPKDLQAELDAAKASSNALTKVESESESELRDEAVSLAESRIRQHRREAYQQYISNKTEALKESQSQLQKLESQSVVQFQQAIKKDNAFGKYLKEKYGEDSRDKIPGTTGAISHVGGFCEWYDKASKGQLMRAQAEEGCIYEQGNACAQELMEQSHRVDGEDDVRPLGLAELVTIEERWLRYKPGEISAIENILKGELHRKETKRTQYFEEFTERMSQDTEEKEVENESKFKQDLSSQIDTELATRFNSDINTSVSGSGGGSIGVVDFEGGASLGAGVGLGMDTSLSTSESSDFSQEIVSKAIERAKKVTQELRRTRSYRLFETSNYHEIDNTSPNSDHTNGIYCYLDKEVCITERIYGIRKFLNAELIYPGNALIKKEAQKSALRLSNFGLPPTFDLSPEDITPDNYLSLVGQFRAANVSPPPPFLKVVSRTYKTDTTNENAQSNGSTIEKVTKALAPFFGEYKRFLIQDNIDIPEGYKVQQVKVTVTHGSNGVSIPAHLPFSLFGASIYAMPTLSAAAIPPLTFYYLPLAVWQVLYTASPLLHYNADSSNVTVNVGHETGESPYFFFQPDEILNEIVSALSNSSIIDEAFVDFLRDRLQTLYDSFLSLDDESVTAALTGLSEETIGEINTFRTDLQKWLGKLVSNIIPNLISGGSGSGPTFEPIPTIKKETVEKIPKVMLAPFKQFFDGVVDHIEDLLQDVLGDIFDYFNTMSDNTDTLDFSATKGFTEQLPVSMNCIALKPGITMNLTACLVRIEDQALDAWRLATFERLSQAYYQLEADYESRSQSLVPGPMHRDSPGLMREEEHEVIKDRVMHILRRKYANSPSGQFSLDELQLFEHAIDWPNVSFRLYNYGPRGRQIAMKKLGMYDHADERRKRFMDALWAQVLLPLREDKRLEQVFLNYLQAGEVNFEADLLAELDDTGADPYDELTEIYRDLVLQRDQLPEVEPRHRRETLPTELIVIHEPQDDEPYPVNPVECLEPDGSDET